MAVVTLILEESSVGVVTASMVETKRVQNLAYTLEHETEVAMENIKTLKRNSHFEAEVLKKFNLIIEKLTNDVHNVVKTIEIIKETMPKAIRLVAYLTTKFHHIKHFT